MPSPTVTIGRIAAFNQVIERQAGALQIPIVRLSREPITDDLVSEIDGFHPSDKGHRQIAQLFLKIILPRFIRAPGVPGAARGGRLELTEITA